MLLTDLLLHFPGRPSVCQWDRLLLHNSLSTNTTVSLTCCMLGSLWLLRAASTPSLHRSLGQSRDLVLFVFRSIFSWQSFLLPLFLNVQTISAVLFRSFFVRKFTYHFCLCLFFQLLFSMFPFQALLFWFYLWKSLPSSIPYTSINGSITSKLIFSTSCGTKGSLKMGYNATTFSLFFYTFCYFYLLSSFFRKLLPKYLKIFVLCGVHIHSASSDGSS